MERYAENILVSIRVKQMYCWADSAWLYIFHFWKCVTQGIKALFENKAADPVPPKLGLSVSFFLSFSLSLLFSGWSPGVQRLSEFTFLPGLLRPNRESALHFHSIEGAPVASVNRASPMSRALLAFCVNQGISASFFILSLADAVHPEGIPGSCWGWTLVVPEKSSSS